MKIALGCDHAGWLLKSDVAEHLKNQGITVVDYGTNSSDSVDYPDFAKQVAESVAGGESDLGVLICGTGLGMAVSANKIHGIRAVTVSEPVSAKMARAHNNANILTFGARIVGPGMALDILDAFLNTEYESGRHARRLEKIVAMEN